MKKTFLTLALFAIFPSAFADQIRVNCALDKTKAFVHILKNDGEDPHVSLYKNGEVLVTLSGPDVFELYQGLYRTNVFAAHHNTHITVSADYNLFGGNIETEGEEKWKGYIFLSPNLAQEFNNKKKFKTTCYFDI